MFHREKVIAALEAKSGHFAGYDVKIGKALTVYEHALETLAQLSQSEILARLDSIPLPGAFPTAEHDQQPVGCRGQGHH